MYEYYCIGNIGNLEADTKDKLKDNEPQADSMTLVGEEEGTREVILLKLSNYLPTVLAKPPPHIIHE